MITIAICDDDAKERKQLENCVRRVLEEQKEIFRLLEFCDGNELLRDYKPGMDILLLDIQMKQMNGIEAAKRIRTVDKDLCVIFITAMPNYAIECYKVRAFGYLLKPVNEVEFEIELREALGLVKRHREETLTVSNHGEHTRLNVKEIIYVDTADHKLKVHCNRDIYSLYQSMSETEVALTGKGFFRVHTAFLVNAQYIESIGYSRLTLKNGEEIPISKHRRQQFLKELGSYLGGEI